MGAKAVRKETFFGARHSDAGLSGVVCIVGQPGTGKTFLTQKLIRPARRVIFFDTVAQVGTGVRQNPLPGFVAIRGLHQLVAYLRPRVQGNFRVVYHPGEHAEEEFDGVCRLVMGARNVVLAVDEVWRFCDPGWMPGPLKQIAFTGRHYGVTLLCTAQRVALVARGLTSVATQFRVFRIQEPRDLAALQGRIPDEALQRIPSLPDRVHVWRDERMNWTIKK